MNIKIVDLGNKRFDDAYQYQLKKVDEVFNKKNEPDFIGYLILLEHPHVYTLGKHGKEDNLLISPQLLEKINAELVKTDRGGDITYHGPGQIVGYPIIDLMKLKIGPKQYVYNGEENDNNIIIKIKDTGIGINENDLPHIFDEFYRTVDAKSRRLSGTGLGLSIVKKMIELYNGTIEVESKVNEYTEFTIILPKIEDNKTKNFIDN
jgi:hypothetical protein